MASVAFLQGRHKILDRTLDWVSGSAIKHILMKSSYAPTVDDDGIATASEISGVSGYTGGFGGGGRKATGARSINRDATNDRIELDAADLASPAWSTLGTGDTIGGVLTAQEVTNDGASLIVVFDDTNNVPTNGGNLDYAINAEGLVWL